jgi:Asp-tRNA(Asn)/Glu-tRNA(Gln) amidotransferase A subunit family amidase
MGLASRDGIIPLYLRNDIGGPMARTVEDAVRVLEVIAGYDSADPITKLSAGKVPKSYTQFLRSDGLKGARLGVFRRYVDAPTTDPQIKALVAKAIEDLKAQGALIVDPFELPNYEELTRNIWCNSFHWDVNNYLASLGERAKYKNLTAIVESGLYSAYIERRLKDAIRTTPQAPPCQDLYHEPRNIAFREALLKAMEQDRLDAIIYPTWSNAPRKIGDLQSPAGDNSQMLSPQTGFPAITVPMGFTYGSLPAGLTFLGRAFSEPDLIRFVYAYEQATKHRRPPEKFPPL